MAEEEAGRLPSRAPPNRPGRSELGGGGGGGGGGLRRRQAPALAANDTSKMGPTRPAEYRTGKSRRMLSFNKRSAAFWSCGATLPLR